MRISVACMSDKNSEKTTIDVVCLDLLICNNGDSSRNWIEKRILIYPLKRGEKILRIYWIRISYKFSSTLLDQVAYEQKLLD